MKWFIKKEIEAPSISQAIANEKKFPVIDAWKAEDKEGNINTYAVGFNHFVEEALDEENFKRK